MDFLTHVWCRAISVGQRLKRLCGLVWLSFCFTMQAAHMYYVQLRRASALWKPRWNSRAWTLPLSRWRLSGCEEKHAWRGYFFPCTWPEEDSVKRAISTVAWTLHVKGGQCCAFSHETGWRLAKGVSDADAAGGGQWQSSFLFLLSWPLFFQCRGQFIFPACRQSGRGTSGRQAERPWSGCRTGRQTLSVRVF